MILNLWTERPLNNSKKKKWYKYYLKYMAVLMRITKKIEDLMRWLVTEEEMKVWHERQEPVRIAEGTCPKASSKGLRKD